jgi:hypothetical protein
LPHLLEGFAHTEFILIATGALDLKEDLQALEGRNDRAGYGTGYATCAERCDEGL